MLNSLKCYLRGEYRPGGFPREFFDRWYKSEGAVENPAGACIFMCDGRMPHGGLSDRLKGALSTYRMARVMGYKFRIHWDSPFNLTDYLVPNRVQWQIAPSEISYSPAQAQPVFVMWNSRNRKWPRTFDTLRFVLFLLRRRRQQHIYSNTSLVTGGASASYIRSCSNRRPVLRPRWSHTAVPWARDTTHIHFGSSSCWAIFTIQ